MSPYKRFQNLRNGGTLARTVYGVAILLVICLGRMLVRTLISYLLHGDPGISAAISDFIFEFIFITVIVAFVAPSLWLATRLEQRLKSRFPVWHTFVALFLTFAPTLVIGCWAAVAVVKALLF